MARHRGHIIFQDKETNLWERRYIAYNAGKDWMMPILTKNDPCTIINKAHGLVDGISTFDAGNTYILSPYHDYINADPWKHKGDSFESLELALASCYLGDAYVWDGTVWSHVAIDVEEVKKKTTPKRQKVNVWRKVRKDREAAGSEPTPE